MAENQEKKIQVTDIRPPNPFDFSSLCEFLDQTFQLSSIMDDYAKSLSMIESKVNERIKEGGKGKEIRIKAFDEDQLEGAFTRALLTISEALVKFKQLSPREQDVKREFLAKDNASSLKNALTVAGFPEHFGRYILERNEKDFAKLNLSRALRKADGVFYRAFYFTLKENELTKKSIQELLDSLKTMEEPEDLKQYLEALLYKVEVASTEKSFDKLKEMVAAPLNEHIKELEKIYQPYFDGKPAPANDPEMPERLKARIDILVDYGEQYFLSNDFVFVEKQLVQLKKKGVEQQDRNSKPIISEEYISTIDRKLMIQLCSAFKKTYNINELYLLKRFLLSHLLGEEEFKPDNELMRKKYDVKRAILLDVLKRIRLDMITEDTFSTATENKKSFIETFEKELLQFAPQQVRRDSLQRAIKMSDDLYNRAQRHLVEKAENKEQQEQEMREFETEIVMTGPRSISAMISMYEYNMAKAKIKTIQEFQEAMEPIMKQIKSTILKIEDKEKKNQMREMVRKRFTAFQKAAIKNTRLDPQQARLFQMYLKGFVDRIRTW